MLGAHGRGTLILRTWHDIQTDAVVLEVHDDGPGVPEEVQARIFDPFFTTKEVGKGTGLGLTVAYAIVREHGGRISVGSDPAGGAAFQVALPAVSASVKPGDASRIERSPTAGSGASVLVVEDEAALGAAVAEALADAGFAVQLARDGLEALERVRAGTYDLIVCDLKMPRLDGMSFYRRIAADEPILAGKVLFVTGDVAGTEAERFLEETGCRWLPKPFRLKDLLRLAGEIVG
jgi:CheY-like chemotaxis protein